MDDVPLSFLLILLAILLVLSAFFSGSETALMALNRYRLRHMAHEGHRGARRTHDLLDKPDRLIGIILLGNNLVNISAATVATLIAMRLAGELGILIAPFVFTVVVLIFAEVAPKTLAAVRPETIAFPASLPLSLLLRLFYPVVAAINAMSNLLLRVFGLKQLQRSDHLSRAELRSMLASPEARSTGVYRSMLVNILDLEHATVQDVMVPRNDMVCLDLDDDWQTVVNQLKNSFYTRLPVYTEEIDQIAGILHVRTVLNRLATDTLDLKSLRKLVRRPYFVPETTSLTQQMLEFQARERRMGLVVDEYGDIQGLITLDDILEEIVGEFTTEPRSRLRRVTKRRDGTFVIDGGENLRSLNRRMGWNLPTEGARTLNGLILEQLETIPKTGTAMDIEGLHIVVTSIEDNAIKSVDVRPA
ncbi:MAG: HlyC/CorC family transporter [Xanthomonadales bacterium]|nr:HlyC/CorC family transporter [Xanthomonadales bacterium]